MKNNRVHRRLKLIPATGRHVLFALDKRIDDMKKLTIHIHVNGQNLKWTCSFDLLQEFF